MANKTLALTAELYSYFKSIAVREDKILQELRTKTQEVFGNEMQIAEEQGQFMAFIIELIAAKNILEIGCFTGYSALVMAKALPEDGKIITCDINAESTGMAKDFWCRAGIAHKIDLRLAEAEKTLAELINSSHIASFDFIFIDADKQNYPLYYEKSLALLRDGGIIAIDNVFLKGKVVDAKTNSKSVVAMRELNDFIFSDERVSFCVLPIADGLTLVRKKILKSKGEKMFLITSKYLQPLEKVDEKRLAHLEYMKEFFASGKLLLAGRKNPVTGAVVIANTNDRQALEKIFANDPYVLAGLAQYEMQEFSLSMAAPNIKELLET